MRRFLLAAVMFGAVSGAQAADLPDFPVLRGSQGLSTPTRNWDGWYAGGQVDYTSVQADFSRSIVGLTNFIFRDSILESAVSQFSLLPKTTTQGSGFGAFVGRNYQWDDLVLGFEANYTYLTSLATSTTGSNVLLVPGEAAPPGHTYTYKVVLTGGSAIQIKDVITFRGRAGWACDDFLPYAFGGLAVGRMDASRRVTSDVSKRDDVTTTDALGNTTTTIGSYFPVPAQSQTLQEGRTNFVAGWTGGLGAEYMVWRGLFVRAEWEYTKFLSIKDTIVQTNSLRAGLGYKF